MLEVLIVYCVRYGSELLSVVPEDDPALLLVELEEATCELWDMVLWHTFEGALIVYTSLWEIDQWQRWTGYTMKALCEER